MKESSDHSYPDLPSRVVVRHSAIPVSGPGTVLSQTGWTVVVRMDRDGTSYLFGKSVVDPLDIQEQSDPPMNVILREGDMIVIAGITYRLNRAVGGEAHFRETAPPE